MEYRPWSRSGKEFSHKFEGERIALTNQGFIVEINFSMAETTATFLNHAHGHS